MPLLPKDYLNTIVCIENVKDKNKFNAMATGFLVGFRSEKKNKKKQDLYYLFLVTNKHVVKNRKSMWLRFNNKEGGFKRYKLELLNEKNEELWLAHSNPKVDVVVITINAEKLEKDGIDFKWIQEDMMAFINKIKSLNISQGDEIFVLGFPMGLAGEEKNYVIVRGGVISRLDKEIIKTTNTFLIDSLIFPGNSGGPVILKPSNISVGDTKPIKKAYLLGLIKGYKPYKEIAYSLQTDPPEPRISFIENSGLASVVPLDYVKDIVSTFISKKEPEKEVNKEKAIK